MVSGFSVRTYNTGVVSSNPTRVTIKTPLARKATGNHLIKSTFLGETQTRPQLLLRLKSSMQRTYLPGKKRELKFEQCRNDD